MKQKYNIYLTNKEEFDFINISLNLYLNPIIVKIIIKAYCVIKIKKFFK